MPKTTKHGLATSKGMVEKKVKDLEAELESYKTVKPRSANAEATKESLRLVVSLLVGMGVAWVYSRYPVLGELQPDQQVVVTVFVTVVVRYLDKFLYQLKKNKGGQWFGLDLPFVALANLFERSKSMRNQVNGVQK